MTTETGKIWLPALKHASITLAIAALLLATIYSVAFFKFHPEFERFNHPDAQPVSIPGKLFKPVVAGGGGIQDNSVIITDFADDKAIIAVPTRFRAEDYPFLKVEMKGLTRFTNARVFWRLASNPEEVYSLPLNRSGDEVTQVAMVYGGDNYKGTVTELIIAFFDGPALGFSNNNEVDIVVGGIELISLGATAVVEQIYEDWFNPPLWQGYSNNIVRGIHENGMIFPNLVLNILVTLSTVVLLTVKYCLPTPWRANLNIAPTVLVVISLCWAMGDVLRWQWRIEQFIDTRERYEGKPLEERIRNNPIRCARFPEDCRADLLPYF
ncbi:hypothetical protein FV139_18000 [Parahaliea maris]|uniref:Uncharacterized protein n=1 Tax=Parahaliea maris TaxID=2716870 RepID=A0A5C8ZTG8_9GAMM|nr:hypothetical protein [Parahaliea maris]TXS90862.1 hypothetical protein FV139_18000 [Parahaliea maris]